MRNSVLGRIVLMLLPAGIVILGVSADSLARGCHQFFQQVVAQPVYAQQVYAQPQVYYSVGQDLQTEALAEKVANLVESKLALRAQQQVQQQEYSKPQPYTQKQSMKGDVPTQAPPPDVANNLPAPPVPQPDPAPAGVNPSQNPNSALVQHCKKCHSGAAPKAGIVFDGITDLKCAQVTAALRQIAANKMPKDHQIDNLAKGALMQELLNLEILPARTIPNPPPIQPVVPPMPNPDLE